MESVKAVKELIKNRCRQYREGRGLTLEELAKRARLSVKSVTDFEEGREYPSYGEWVALAKAFGVTTAELVQGIF